MPHKEPKITGPVVPQTDADYNKIALRFLLRDGWENSVVRLDQEQLLLDTLQDSKPVLIRGTIRIGKTTMLDALQRHFKFGLRCEPSGNDTELTFSMREVATFLTDFNADEKLDSNVWWGKKAEWEKTIQQSAFSPLEFFNTWLGERKLKAFVGIDEALRQADFLPVLAKVNQYKNLHLAIVLHQAHKEDEEGFAKIFPGWTSQFIRSITQEEVRTHLAVSLQNTGIQFSDEAIVALHRVSGGRPLEINITLNNLIGSYNEKHRKKLLYEEEDVVEAASMTMWERFGMGFPEGYSQPHAAYTTVYRALNDSQRAFVHDLLDHKQIGKEHVRPALVQMLLNVTFVYIDKQTGMYRINGTLLEDIWRNMREQRNT